MDYKSCKSQKVGETNKMNCGQFCTIIKYNNYDDIDVQFEDGTVVKRKKYSNFKEGRIGYPGIDGRSRINPSTMIGKKKKMSCGLDATIIAWRKSNDMDVQFADGVIIKHTKHDAFKKGIIGHPDINAYSRIDPSTMIGKRKKMSCGLDATIIAWRSCKDMDVRFTDGTIIKHRAYKEFKKGNIAHPTINPGKIGPSTKIGEKGMSKCGIGYSIVRWQEYKDVEVQFEDGIVVNHRNYYAFKNGSILHPDFNSGGKYYKTKNFHHFTAQLETIVNDEKKQVGLFKCSCNICGQQGIYTVSLMLDHEQKHVNNGDIVQ